MASLKAVVAKLSPKAAAVAISRKKRLYAYAKREDVAIPSGLRINTPTFGPQARLLLQRVRNHALGEYVAIFDDRLATVLAAPTLAEAYTTQLELWAAQGLKESPAGSNKVPALAAVARALGLGTFYQNMGWPWCMFAVFLAAYKHGSETAKIGFTKGASVWNVLYTVDLLRIANKGLYGTRRVDKKNWKRGTILLINFPGGQVVDHVLVLRSKPLLGFARVVQISTAEGNTSLDDAGSQSNGGAMAKRIRRVTDSDLFGVEIS